MLRILNNFNDPVSIFDVVRKVGYLLIEYVITAVLP